MTIASSTVVAKSRTAVLGFQGDVLKSREIWLGRRITRRVETHAGDIIEVSRYKIMSDLQESIPGGRRDIFVSTKIKIGFVALYMTTLSPLPQLDLLKRCKTWAAVNWLL